MDDRDAAPEPPSKRVKLSGQADGPDDGPSDGADGTSDLTSHQGPLRSATVSPHDQDAKEQAVGITSFVNSTSPRVQGVLKKRYTDFLVNEVLPNGQVLHLKSITVSRPTRGPSPAPEHPATEAAARVAGLVPGVSASDEPASALPSTPAAPPLETAAPDDGAVGDSDKDKLTGFFPGEAVTELLDLYSRILASPGAKSPELGSVQTEFTTDRSVRSMIHQEIKRIFHGKIDSSTDKNGRLNLFAAAPARSHRPRQPGGDHDRRQGKAKKPTWHDRGGEFLHFSLYKENKDTMEVVAFLNRQLKTNAKVFQFAGTKDRRAVTVQRLSAYRIEADRMAGVNKMLRGASAGDFEYQKNGLELGDLKGNEFVITLRECSSEAGQGLSLPAQVESLRAGMETAMASLHEKGFFNYYGLQRFGTFATRTDAIGIRLLRGDFEGACDDILEYNPEALAAAQNPVAPGADSVGSDDKARAEALHIFHTTHDAAAALAKLPRKFSAEQSLIRHLSRHPTDFGGAILAIQRNLRLIYVHAYQSLVWNLAVNERWALYGDTVVAGDLVMVDEHRSKERAPASAPDAVDADGEVVIQPGSDDRAHSADDIFSRARALSAAEAASGHYSIFDVVLPLPGFDVEYPPNAVGAWYQTFMASARGGGLDPHDMRRKQKDLSLSGSYRKILARIEPDWAVDVKAYGDENEQFVETDLAKLRRAQEIDDGGTGPPTTVDHAAVGAGAAPDKIAVILKFQLGSSQYATVALRELSHGGIAAHKPEFSGGR